jgi:ornithine decarboxylase
MEGKMHYLRIAARKDLLPYLPKNWPTIELKENLNGAYLAAVVVRKRIAVEWVCKKYLLNN